MKKRLLIAIVIALILIVAGLLLGRFFMEKESIDFSKIFAIGTFGVPGKSLALPTDTIGESVESNFFSRVKLNPFEEET